jgi:hypothetical protein
VNVGEPARLRHTLKKEQSIMLTRGLDSFTFLRVFQCQSYKALLVFPIHTKNQSCYREFQKGFVLNAYLSLANCKYKGAGLKKIAPIFKSKIKQLFRPAPIILNLD